MSNLPKIYGNCKAGCLWETVHRSEFEKSASIVKVFPNEDGAYTLDIGKKYKIKAKDGSAWGGLSILLECTYSEGKKTLAVANPHQQHKNKQKSNTKNISFSIEYSTNDEFYKRFIK